MDLLFTLCPVLVGFFTVAGMSDLERVLGRGDLFIATAGLLASQIGRWAGQGSDSRILLLVLLIAAALLCSFLFMMASGNYAAAHPDPSDLPSVIIERPGFSRELVPVRQRPPYPLLAWLGVGKSSVAVLAGGITLVIYSIRARVQDGGTTHAHS